MIFIQFQLDEVQEADVFKTKTLWVTEQRITKYKYST